jgi:hypothetical protein
MKAGLAGTAIPRQLLAELVSAGAVKVRSSATGTVVSLVTPAAA